MLDDGGRLFSHLGMTGWWVERDANAPTERSERARIDIVREDGRNASARYLDSRRFGRLIVADRDIDEWSTLGPDPLADGIDATAPAATTRTGYTCGLLLRQLFRNPTSRRWTDLSLAHRAERSTQQ